MSKQAYAIGYMQNIPVEIKKHDRLWNEIGHIYNLAIMKENITKSKEQT
jgi:hypothetical protein